MNKVLNLKKKQITNTSKVNKSPSRSPTERKKSKQNKRYNFLNLVSGKMPPPNINISINTPFDHSNSPRTLMNNSSKLKNIQQGIISEGGTKPFYFKNKFLNGKTKRVQQKSKVLSCTSGPNKENINPNCIDKPICDNQANDSNFIALSTTQITNFEKFDNLPQKSLSFFSTKDNISQDPYPHPSLNRDLNLSNIYSDIRGRIGNNNGSSSNEAKFIELLQAKDLPQINKISKVDMNSPKLIGDLLNKNLLIDINQPLANNTHIINGTTTKSADRSKLKRSYSYNKVCFNSNLNDGNQSESKMPEHTSCHSSLERKNNTINAISCERCANHPHKKAKYLTEKVIDGKDIIIGKYCSKCAISMALQGVKMKEMMIIDTSKNKSELEELLVLLSIIKRNILQNMELFLRKKEDIITFYHNQTEKSEYIYNTIHKIILEEKIRSMDILNQNKDEVLNKIQIHQKQFEYILNQINSVEQSMQNYIKNIDLDPSQDVMTRFKDKLNEYESFNEQINNNSLNINKLPTLKQESLDNLKPIILSLYNMMKVSTSLIKKRDLCTDYHGNNTNKNTNIQNSSGNNNGNIDGISNGTNNIMGGTNNSANNIFGRGIGNVGGIGFYQMNSENMLSNLNKSSLYISFDNKDIFKNAMVNYKSDSNKSSSEAFIAYDKQQQLQLQSNHINHDQSLNHKKSCMHNKSSLSSNNILDMEFNNINQIDYTHRLSYKVDDIEDKQQSHQQQQQLQSIQHQQLNNSIYNDKNKEKITNNIDDKDEDHVCRINLERKNLNEKKNGMSINIDDNMKYKGLQFDQFYTAKSNKTNFINHLQNFISKQNNLNFQQYHPNILSIMANDDLQNDNQIQSYTNLSSNYPKISTLSQYVHDVENNNFSNTIIAAHNNAAFVNGLSNNANISHIINTPYAASTSQMHYDSNTGDQLHNKKSLTDYKRMHNTKKYLNLLDKINTNQSLKSVSYVHMIQNKPVLSPKNIKSNNTYNFKDNELSSISTSDIIKLIGLLPSTSGMNDLENDLKSKPNNGLLDDMMVIDSNQNNVFKYDNPYDHNSNSNNSMSNNTNTTNTMNNVKLSSRSLLIRSSAEEYGQVCNGINLNINTDLPNINEEYMLFEKLFMNDIKLNSDKSNNMLFPTYQKAPFCSPNFKDNMPMHKPND